MNGFSHPSFGQHLSHRSILIKCLGNPSSPTYKIESPRKRIHLIGEFFWLGGGGFSKLRKMMDEDIKTQSI